MKTSLHTLAILLVFGSSTAFYAKDTNERSEKPLEKKVEAANKNSIQEDATKFQNEATVWLLAKQAEFNKERVILQSQYPILYPVAETGVSVGFFAGGLKRVAPHKIFPRAGKNIFHCGVRGAAMGAVCHLGIKFAQEFPILAGFKNSPAHDLAKQQAPELVKQVDQIIDQGTAKLTTQKDKASDKEDKPADNKETTLNPVLVTFLLAFAAA